MPWDLVVPVLDSSVRKLCARPYDRHPRGCPNYGKHQRCPPRAPMLHEHFSPDGPFYAIWSTFLLGDHVREMRERHPGWSEAQIRNVLYWQGTARKRLRAEIAAFRRDPMVPRARWVVEETPEAMGVDVTNTVAQAGLILSWPPTEVVHHVALAGVSRLPPCRLCGQILCGCPSRGAP